MPPRGETIVQERHRRWSIVDSLVRAGTVRYVGVSNFSGWHLMKSLAVADRYGYPYWHQRGFTERNPPPV